MSDDRSTAERSPPEGATEIDLEKGSTVARIGADRLVKKGECLVLYAAEEMPDWEVRRYRRVRIHVYGVGYQPVRKTLLADGRVRYLLEPWPRDTSDLPSLEVFYDDAYVASREDRRRAILRRSRVLPLLAPLVPIAGFLPSSWQARLHERLGLHPRTITAFSLGIEYVLIVAHTGLLAIHMGTGVFSTKYLVAALLVLVPDAVVRYGHLLEGRMDPPGFYEWVFRRRHRR